MVNVKLGDKTYEGVTAVKTDTTDGGTAEFAPYDETFAAGKAEGVEEGYAAGKTDGIAEGVQTEYDRFWDSFQNYGNPARYEYAFAGNGNWTPENFKPKHDLVASTGYSVTSMFQASALEISELLEEQGRKLDTSRCWYFNNMYLSCYAQRIPGADTTNAIDAQLCFAHFKGHTIDKVIANESCQYNNAFQNADALVNITFDGVIGKDINLQWSPLTPASMKSVIMHLKNYSETTEVDTHSVTFSDTCWTTLEADGTTAPDGKTWRAYTEETLGWLT